jgi:hypothetical protein
MKKKLLITLLILFSLFFVFPYFFIQSKTFARFATKIIQKQVLGKLKVKAKFSELNTKFLPPGFTIYEPIVEFDKDNALSVPEGLSLRAKKIEVSFELIQAFSSGLNLKSIVIDGADFQGEIFKESIEVFTKNKIAVKSQKQSLLDKAKEKLFWNSLTEIQIQSISFINSKFDFNYKKNLKSDAIHGVVYAKNLTIGKSFVNEVLGYDFGIDLKDSFLELNKNKFLIEQVQVAGFLSQNVINFRNFSIQDQGRLVHINGSILGNILDSSTYNFNLHLSVKSPIDKILQDPWLRAWTKNIQKNYTLSGLLKLESDFNFSLKKPLASLQGSYQLKLEEFKFLEWSANSLEVQGKVQEKNLSVNQILLELSSGKAKFQVSDLKSILNLESFKFENKAKLQLKSELDNVAIKEVAGGLSKNLVPLKAKISGTIESVIEWDLEKKQEPYAINSKSSLLVENFIFDNEEFDKKKEIHKLIELKKAQLDLKTQINNKGIWFQDLTLKLGNTNFKMLGSITENKGINFDILGNVNLEDINTLSEVPIRGNGTLHWLIVQNANDLLFDFKFKLKEASYLNLNLGNCDGRIIYNDTKEILIFDSIKLKQGALLANASGSLDLTKDKINMNVDLVEATIPDLAVVLDYFIKKSVPWYPQDLNGMAKGNVSITGNIDSIDNLSILANLNLQKIEYWGEIFQNASLFFGLEQGDIVAKKVKILKKNGSIFGNFTYFKNNQIKYDLSTLNLTTSDFNFFTRYELPYYAPLEVSATGEGKVDALKTKIIAKVFSGNIRRFFVPESEFNLESDGNKVLISSKIFNDSAGFKLEYNLQKNLQNQFSGYAKNFDFMPVIAFLNPDLIQNEEIKSQVSGEAILNFQSDDLRHSTGKVLISDFFIKRKRGGLELDKPVSIEFKNGNFNLTKFSLTGLDSNIEVLSEIVEEKISLEAKGALNLSLFEIIIPEFERASGLMNLELKARGVLSDPHFKLEASAQNALIRLKTLNQPFEALNYKIEVSDGFGKLQYLNANFSSGKITGSGNFELFKTQFPSLDLNFNLEGAKLQVYPVVYARSSGKLRVSGNSFPYLLSGDVFISDALIKQNFDVGSNKTLKMTRFLPETRLADKSNFLELNIKVQADRNFLIKNDLFDAELSCNLNILKSINAPGLVGEINVLSGRLYFKDNYFTIQNGKLKFIDPLKMDPEFELVGTTEVKGYKITLLANGKTSDYKINFQSQPPLSQNDIVTLLTLGNTVSAYQSISGANREAYTRDEMVGLIFNQSSVNKGLKEKLGVNLKVDQSANYAPVSVFRSQSGSDATSTISPKVTIQKQITKKLSASAGTTVGVGDNRQQDFKVEYDFDSKWSVMGIFEDQRGTLPQNTRTSVGADLKYKIKFK